MEKLFKRLLKIDCKSEKVMIGLVNGQATNDSKPNQMTNDQKSKNQNERHCFIQSR